MFLSEMTTNYHFGCPTSQGTYNHPPGWCLPIVYIFIQTIMLSKKGRHHG
jgi:hypothetical protein